MDANPDPPFKVESLRAARDALRGFIQHAASPSLRLQIIHAAKAIFQELQVRPLSFGEPRNYLQNLGLEVRVGGIGPLVVTYGVHAHDRFVVIRTAHLLDSV